MTDAYEDRLYSNQIASKYAPDIIDEKIKKSLIDAVGTAAHIGDEIQKKILAERLLKETHDRLTRNGHYYESASEFLGDLTRGVVQGATNHRLGKPIASIVSGDIQGIAGKKGRPPSNGR